MSALRQSGGRTKRLQPYEVVPRDKFPRCPNRKPALYQALDYLQARRPGRVVRIEAPASKKEIHTLQRRMWRFATCHGMKIASRAQDGWFYMKRVA